MHVVAQQDDCRAASRPLDQAACALRGSLHIRRLMAHERHARPCPALGPGTDVAQETVDAAILRDPVRDGAGRIRSSRARMANIRQNIALAHRLRGVFLATPVFGITTL